MIMSRNRTCLAVVSVCIVYVGSLGAQPPPRCEQWNTEKFFRTASPALVTACLEAGASLEGLSEPSGGAEAVLRRAAEEFEQRVFLSTLNDIRNFCEAYGIEEPRSKSRASGIPRVFKFLVTMDVADVERMLDDRMFSGPAQLGPVADAIRGKAKEYRDAAIDHS